MTIYNANIPQPGDNLSNSQGDLLANFQQIDITVGKNHYPTSNVTANNGKHKFVEMPNGTLPAGLVAAESTLYSKLDASSLSQLFYTRDNSGIEIQMTAGTLAPVRLQNGFSFLMGNMLIQWGFNTVASGTGQINFSPTFANVGAFPPVVTIAPYNTTTSDNRSFYITATAFDKFTYNNTGSATTKVYWMAIGPI